MSNATRWYATRGAVKAAAEIAGPELDGLVDDYIEAGSEDVEQFLNRRFIPETSQKFFRYPQLLGNPLVLTFPGEDLLAVTLLEADALASSPTTIVAADYFLEPVNYPVKGLPFNRIEIDTSSTASFAASADTPQRSVGVTGRWGYTEATLAAGALAEDDDGSEVLLDVTDSSLINVGDTILIGSEAMFVSKRDLLDTATELNDTLTADVTDVTVTLDVAVIAGEVITIDSEEMLVVSVSGLDHTVIRAVNGSIIASHSNTTTVFAPRTLTVTRGENGTTAAAHTSADAIVKYAPPADIVRYVVAYALNQRHQDQSGQSGMIGGDQAGIDQRGLFLFHMKNALIEKYGKVSL